MVRKARWEGAKLIVRSGTAKVEAWWIEMPYGGEDVQIRVIDKGAPEDLEDALSVIRQMLLGEE